MLVAASAWVLLDPLMNKVVVASTVDPSRKVTVPVGAVEFPQPDPVIKACTLNVEFTVIEAGGPNEVRHTMVGVALGLTVIAVFSVEAVLQVSPEYWTVSVRTPDVGMVIEAATDA
jgi:hypothetical protein